MKKDKSSQKQRKGRLFQKGVSGNPGGMKKGTKHNATLIKEAFFQAFDDIGGIDALAEWAKKSRNQKDFYKILASLLPKDLDLNIPDETLKAWEDVKADALIETAQKLAREITEITNGNIRNKEANGE